MKSCIHYALRARLSWLLVMAIVTSLINVTRAATIRVPQDRSTVRAAYAAAQDGDTIVIASGLYLESPGPFSPAKRVTLVPTNGLAIVSVNTPPPNDNFANRTLLTGDVVQASALNYAASAEPGEPTNFRGDPPIRSVWWRWTAPTTGVVVINTVGSDFTAIVDVFTGHAFPLMPIPESALDSRSLNEVSFVAQQGVTYQIVVNAPHTDAYGQVTLNVVMPAPPANDDFADRFVLEGIAPKAGSYTYSARRETPNEPNHAGRAAGRSIWFSWTAPTNDPSPTRPVTISTFGSDFDTVLAVYVGTALANLVPVASTDDIDFGNPASRVTFIPTPGTVYQIAVDGSTKNGANADRYRFGNVVLSVDYSLVNISLLSVSPLATHTNGAISFRADLRLLNGGTEPAGPLRLRLLAVSGVVPAAVHLAGPEFQTDLDIIQLSAPDSLNPGADRFVNVTNECPAPVTDRQSATGYRGHAVFALLEERIGSRWVPLDGEFLLHGSFPGERVLVINLGIPLRANVNLPRVNGTEITVEFLVLRGPSSIVEGSTNAVTIFARLSDDSEVVVGPDEVVWSGPTNLLFSADLVLTNSAFAAGQVSQRLLVTNTCRFSYGGTVYIARYVLTVYQRPFLEAVFPPPYTQFVVRLTGEPGKQYVVEASPELREHWQPLATNVLTAANGRWDFTEPSTPQNRQRFFRAREVP